MSFILEALKKADSERKLAELPGIFTQQSPQPLALERSLLRRWRLALWLLCLPALAGGLLIWTTVVPTPPAKVSSPVRPTDVVAIATEIPLPPAVKMTPQAEAKALPARVPAAVSAALVTSHAIDQKPLTRIIGITELPAQIQSTLPVFVISGSMYSDNPAERMLLVDKRMLREGDEIAPGLLLVSVLPKGATLRFKGYVFGVTR